MIAGAGADAGAGPAGASAGDRRDPARPQPEPREVEVLDEDTRRAYAFVLRSTQHRPQTLAELRAKLRRRGVDADVADGALRHAQANGVIDDRAFARAWVEDRGRQRGFGAARLRQELRRRLVDEALIDEALEALGDRDDLAVATQLGAEQARRYPPALEPAAVARRLVGYLVRRGHSPAIAQRAARTVAGLDRSWD